MSYVPRKFYQQVTYSKQKQAYVFKVNVAIVPIEKIMYVIYHDPSERSFQYDKKTDATNQCI